MRFSYCFIIRFHLNSYLIFILISSNSHLIQKHFKFIRPPFLKKKINIFIEEKEKEKKTSKEGKEGKERKGERQDKIYKEWISPNVYGSRVLTSSARKESIS